MSKLVEKLQRISEGAAQPLGFKPASASAPKQRMLLIATLVQGDMAKAAEAVAPQVDAIVLSSETASAVRPIVETLGDVPWGVWLKTPNQEAIRDFQEAGCDFLVLGATAPASIILEKQLGKLLGVDLNMSDSSIRALGWLPVDGVFISLEEESFLTVRQLVECQRLSLAEKPLLVVAPDSLRDSDLEPLWEVGVAGVMIKLEGEAVKEKSLSLRRAMDSLPPASKRRGRKERALLPHLETSSSLDEEEEEERLGDLPSDFLRTPLQSFQSPVITTTEFNI